MWLRLTYTYLDGSIETTQAIAVNTDAVKRIVDRVDRDGKHVGCKVQFTDGETIAVKESYTLVTAMLEGEVAGSGDKFKGAIRG